MKRIERNTYNSLRKSITAETINVEIPVEYTHEGRQGIHEMLTIEKHMRASMICWNSIINGYVIHYVPTVDEYTEAQRMEQEAQDIDEVMNTLPKSDRTWNGYEKPAETTETAEQVEETETEETETTTEAAETEAETIEETAEEAKEVVTMKKYFKVTFEYAEGIYCTNLAHAETAEDVEREYSKYPWQSVKEAQPWDVDEAKMKGMPIIEVEAAQQPQEAPAEEQTTEAETEEEETETPATPGEMLKVRNVIMGRGGYRERELLKAPHTMTHGETWNDAHKVVNIIATTPDPDGYCPGCAVDIVARAIVG